MQKLIANSFFLSFMAIIFFNNTSNIAIAVDQTNPSRVGAESHVGTMYVYNSITPPFDEKNTQKLNKLEALLNRQTKGKSRQAVLKQIEKLKNNWDKFGPKVLRVQVASESSKCKIPILVTITRNQYKSYKILPGSFYSVKLHPGNYSMKIRNNAEYQTTRHATFNSATNCDEPKWWRSIPSGYATWIPEITNQHSIIVKDFIFEGFDSWVSSPTYIQTAAGSMRTGGGRSGYYSDYKLQIKNSGKRDILLTTLIYEFTDKSGRILERGEVKGSKFVRVQNWVAGEVKSFNIRCICKDSELLPSIKVIQLVYN